MNVIAVIAPVFLIIFLGYLFGKKISIDIKSISNLSIYVLAPALIIYSLSLRKFDASSITIMVVAAAITLILGGVAVLVSRISRLGKSEETCLLMTTMFMNAMYMGFPIALLAFGEEGLAHAAVFAVVSGILMYSLGVFLVSGKKFFEFLKLPLFYASIIGIAISFFALQIPEVPATVLEMVGKAAIPVNLLLLGTQLSRVKLRLGLGEIKLPSLNIVTKMIIAPIIAFLVCVLTGLSGIIAGVVVIEASMPPAIYTFVLAAKYDNKPEKFATIVFFSTLVSIISIPIILWLLTWVK